MGLKFKQVDEKADTEAEGNSCDRNRKKKEFKLSQVWNDQSEFL